MATIRILYISYVQYGAGDWVHTREFLAAASTLPCELVHFPPLPKPVTGGDVAASVGRGGYPRHCRELRFLVAAFFKKIGAEYRIIRASRPDLILLRVDRYLSAVILARLLSIPLVLEVNAPMAEARFRPRQERLRGLPLWEFLYRGLFRCAARIMVVSEPLRRYYLAQGIAPDKICAVANGVDTERFRPGVGREEMRQRLGLTGKVVIGFSGTFLPWHGLDFAVKAFATLLCEGQRTGRMLHLLLVGKPSSGFAMPVLPAERATVTGQVAHGEVPAYLSAMDIFLAPYPSIEPFYFSPLKILEAMAMGLPVVASAQGQIAELISDGVDGFLYPPGNMEILLEKLQRLIADQDLRSTMGAAARRKVTGGYTWTDNARRVLALCQEAAQHPNP